jgi:hypothetical protein
LLKPLSEQFSITAGVIDVINFYVETADDVAERRTLPIEPALLLYLQAPDTHTNVKLNWSIGSQKSYGQHRRWAGRTSFARGAA